MPSLKRKMLRTPELSLEQIQLLLSKNISLHPIMEEVYAQLLKNKEAKGTISLLPVTILIMYDKRVTRKLQKTA